MRDPDDAPLDSGIVQPAWLSVDEACIYINCSVRHFYRHVADKVDVRKQGRRSVVSVASLDQHMQSLPRIPKAGLRHARGVEPIGTKQTPAAHSPLPKKKARHMGGRSLAR